MCFWISFDEPCSLGAIRKKLMRKKDLQNLSGKPELLCWWWWHKSWVMAWRMESKKLAAEKGRRLCEKEGERSNIMAKYLKLIQNEGLLIFFCVMTWNYQGLEWPQNPTIQRFWNRKMHNIVLSWNEKLS